MKKNFKLAFVWDFNVEPMMLAGWDDGLKKALELLAYNYGWEVNVITGDKLPEIRQKILAFKPDAILCWGSLDRDSFGGIKEYGIPTAICFAGGSTVHPHKDNFDIIFVESDVYEDAFKKQGDKVIRAFGTNHYLFQPLNLRKHFKAFFGATYSNWKRFYLFADAVGERGITSGRILPHEYGNFKYCAEKGVMTLTDVTCSVMPYLYNQSEFALITAQMGGQRNVLEAMACNVIPIVMSDNPTTCEYVKESGFGVIVDPDVDKLKEALEKTYGFKENMGRDYVMSKWSADIYAKNLKEGIESIL